MKPSFETKLSLVDSLPHILEFILILAVGISVIKKADLNSIILTSCFIALIIFGAINLMRKLKTFHLYPDRLIIKRPLFLTEKMNIVFEHKNIKEIVFRKISGRFRGESINIYSKDLDDSFGLNMPQEELEAFISKLKETNIKIESL